ncbi:sugar nucleotide-binding protein, partial [Fulvivirga kasyanovii]
LLVLGASSWLGYLLINNKVIQKYFKEISGTIFKNTVNFNHPVNILKTNTGHLDLRQIADWKPSHVINFLRGETEADFIYHDKLASYCEQAGANYFYLSSALALDGYKDAPLMESLEACAVSPYGKFKGRCEQRLYDSNSLNWTILRFASVQGYVPHKQTRNEVFLSKMKKGEKVIVDRGVVQNRMLADRLIGGLSKLIRDNITGIIHFGTMDSSEEYDFLRQQGERFGWDPENVVSGSLRNVNLNTIPGKILELYGTEFRLSENDTIDDLLADEGLKKYKNN